MIALDTNIVVRLLTADDPDQLEIARRLVKEADALWLSKTVLLETAWVLRHSYGLSREVILLAFWKLLGYRQLQIEDRAAVARALEWYAAGLDLADALHLASGDARSAFATFNRKLARLAGKLDDGPEVRLLQ